MLNSEFTKKIERPKTSVLTCSFLGSFWAVFCQLAIVRIHNLILFSSTYVQKVFNNT